MLKLGSVMLEECPHEAAQGRSEPVVVELDEGHHVTFTRAQLLVFHRRRDPLWLLRGSS